MMGLNHHLTSPDSPKSLGPSETPRLNTENLCVCLVNNEAPPSLREERFPMDAFNGLCYSERGCMVCISVCNCDLAGFRHIKASDDMCAVSAVFVERLCLQLCTKTACKDLAIRAHFCVKGM